MIALNSSIEASDPHINVMLNCKIGDLKIHIFALNLENGAPELYVFTLTWKWGPLSHYFNAKFEQMGP